MENYEAVEPVITYKDNALVRQRIMADRSKQLVQCNHRKEEKKELLQFLGPVTETSITAVAYNNIASVVTDPEQRSQSCYSPK